VWTAASFTLTYVVEQSVIDVFVNRFIDLSSFSFFNLADQFTTYAVEFPPTAAQLQPKDEVYATFQVLQAP